MTGRPFGPWLSPRRTVALVVLAAASVVDLSAYAVLASRPGPAQPGPGSVALTVTSAVAADDCAGIDDLLADDADLPPAVTACLEGRAGAADLTDVEVLDVTEVGDDGARLAVVTVGLLADGAAAEVVVDLRRDDGAWTVTGVRAAG